MKIFITMQDLQQLDPQDPAFEVVRKQLESMSDLYPENGYLVLVEETDTERAPCVTGGTALLGLDIMSAWEGCIKRDGLYLPDLPDNNCLRDRPDPAVCRYG